MMQTLSGLILLLLATTARASTVHVVKAVADCIFQVRSPATCARCVCGHNYGNSELVVRLRADEN